MPVTFNVDPTDPIGSRAQSRYDQSRNDQLYQANVDNQFRNMQHHTNEEWNWRKYNDSKNKLQLLVEDARKAGISPLASLGAGGASPANISVPVGQGGRVSGGYQRKTPMEVQITANAIKKDNLDTEMKWLTYQGMVKDLQMKSWQYNRMLDDPLNPQFYVPFNNNYDEATTWEKQGLIPVINPDANMEVNESVGSYYFFKPRPEGFVNTVME